jgi:hypothetical protein
VPSVELPLVLRDLLRSQGYHAMWRARAQELIVMPHPFRELVWNVVTFTDPSCLFGVSRSFEGMTRGRNRTVDELRECVSAELDRSWQGTLDAIRELCGSTGDPSRN